MFVPRVKVCQTFNLGYGSLLVFVRSDSDARHVAGFTFFAPGASAGAESGSQGLPFHSA